MIRIERYLRLLLIFVVITSCSTSEQMKWRIVLKTDREGVIVKGSKDELIDAIRAGNDIKIGWGGKGENHSIEHVIEPIWLAILDEKEVIAHAEPQVLSVTDWESLTANYTDSTKLKEEWRVVITTKGGFDAIWFDRESNKQITRRPQNHPISWFVKGNRLDGEIPESLF